MKLFRYFAPTSLKKIKKQQPSAFLKIMKTEAESLYNSSINQLVQILIFIQIFDKGL